MKRILLIGIAQFAYAATTTVTGPVLTPDGTAATGTAIITLSRACVAAGGGMVLNRPVTVAITAGTLTADLEPNDTCVPSGSYYRVEFRLTGFSLRYETWIVPTSASPVSIASVRNTAPVGAALPSLGISLLTGGLVKGDLIVYDGAIFRRLGAGTNGHVLTADSTQAYGIKWAVAAGGGGGGSVTGGGCPAGQYTISTDTQAVPTCSQVLWSQLGSVPSTFTPSAHNHAASELTSGTLGAARMPALTGDVTSSAGAVATTIAANAVTNAKAAQMAANTIKANNTGSTANAADITVAQAKTMLAISASDVSGLAASATTDTTNAANISSGTLPIGRLPAHNHAASEITSGVIDISRLATGTPNGSKFIRDDGTLQPIPGGGDALTASPLSQFAATTSAQLRGVLSDESGTGAAYFAGGDLGTPSAGVLTNATGLPYAALTGVPSTFAPSAHASSHQHGGTDQIATATPGANAIPKAGAGGALAAGWLQEVLGLADLTDVTTKRGNSTSVQMAGAGTPATDDCAKFDANGNVVSAGAACGSGGGVSDGDKGDIVISGTGAVYTIDAGAVGDSKVAAGVAATKVGGGGVDNTEFGHLDGVTSAIQTQLNAKATLARAAVSFSATPTFTRTAQIQEWSISLTGNVTSSTTSGLASGDLLSFEICQDATGGRTFAWPTGFSKASPIVPTASACSKQLFTWNGTSAEPQAGMISDESGVVVRGPTVAALATPASGSVCWIDSTAGGWSCKDSSGNVTIMPRVEASATSNQFVTHIPASGVLAKAQPAFSNLSGTATDAQIPDLNTLSTGLTGSRCVETDGSGLLTVAAGACAGSGGGGTVTSVDAAGGVETASGSAITTSGTIRASMLVNAQTGTTYAVLTGDRGKLVTLSNASSIAVTLPQAGGTFPAGWYVLMNNIGAGTVTVTPTTSTVSGAATITLETGEWALVTSDGTNYNAIGNRITAGTNVTLTKSRTGVQVAAAGGGGSACVSVGATGNYVVPGAPGPLTMNGYGNDNVMAPSGGGGANQSVLWHVFMPCEFTPNSISFNVTTAGGAGCRVEVGVYNDSKSLIIRSGILEDSATTVQCDTTGVKTLTSATSPAATGLGTTRSPGWYWIAATSNEATSRITAMWVTAATNTFLGGLGGGQFGILSGAQVTSGGSLLSSFTTGSGWTQTTVYMPTLVLWQ